MKPESVIQHEIVKFYTNTYCLVHHSPRCLIASIPNGGFRNQREAVTLKSTGALAGASDMILIHRKSLDKPSILAFIEVKTQVGLQSDVQKSFMNRVLDLGFKYTIVRNLEDFKDFIFKL